MELEEATCVLDTGRCAPPGFVALATRANVSACRTSLGLIQVNVMSRC